MGFAINPFLEQISDAFNKNITIENLSRELIAIEVQNDSDGGLSIPIQFKTALTGRILGLSVISATNLTNSNTYPLNTPFISWTINQKIIKVLNITGIQPNNKYRLMVEVIS